MLPDFFSTLLSLQFGLDCVEEGLHLKGFLKRGELSAFTCSEEGGSLCAA